MIDSIRLQNYRSYKDDSFEFDRGVNIVIGPNTSGKTNLLEAILMLASGRSYRARDFDLLQFDAPWSRLDGYFGKHQRVVKLVPNNPLQGRALQKGMLHHNSRFAGLGLANTNRVIKELVLDGKSFKRLSLERSVPVVLFEPNHLQLLIRGPEHRRQCFDDILERSKPGFKSLSARYRRALAQRNSLLKQPPDRAKKQLFAWNIRLSELGAQIASARQELIEDINQAVAKTYSRIAGRRSTVELIYDSQFKLDNYSSRLLAKLEATAETDFARGFTTYGPHREDITAYLNKQPAGISASRGETRSLVLALKLFELKRLEAGRDQKPIFLLDDVFSELDGARRRHLVDNLKGYQTIITTTDADAVLEYFSKNHHLISL